MGIDGWLGIHEYRSRLAGIVMKTCNVGEQVQVQSKIVRFVSGSGWA
jgi:hypothetical protein